MPKKFEWDGAKLKKVVYKTVMKAFRTMGEKILTEAKKPHEVPVLTGTLRRSGTVTEGGLPDPKEVFQGAKLAVEGGGEQDFAKSFPKPIGTESNIYVSFNTPYALIQHEELGFNHPSGGKALYLRDPFYRFADKAFEYAQLRVNKALRDAK